MNIGIDKVENAESIGIRWIPVSREMLEEARVV